MIVTTISFAKKWDATYISKLIASGGIDKVIEYYKGRYYGVNRDPQDAFKIAELYVKKKDYATAMQWYDKESQLINTSKVNLFNYANTNRLMGEYQKALDGYLMYAALTGDVNKVMDLANQCEKILKSAALAYNYKLENYTYNTSADETNVAVLRTNPVYVTVKNENTKEDKPTYDIYQVVRDFENFAEPVNAYNKSIPKALVTSLSYTQDGNSVVFSVRDEKTSSKKGKIKNEKIFLADNLGGSFLNVKPFPFYTEGYSFKNPSYNTNGTAIYFSSNQTGGFGGFDIWKSDLVNGKWTTPKNLGKLLNSKSDEINPFVLQDGKDNTLYFSSDREGGFGGFDIYAATKANNIWEGVELQSAPINSAGDDVSVIYDADVKTGYVTSNRNGGKGGFDVYRFTPFNLKLIVNTNDTFSDKLIDYALVQVYDGAEKLFEGVTDETGKAVFQINKNKNYTLRISKDNYRPIIQKVSSNGKTSGDSVIAIALLKPDAQFSIAKGATNNLSLDNYIIFTGKVIDAATNKPAYTAQMRMVNYTTQRLREVDIDSTGRFEIKLLLNNNYKVIFENQENKVTDELTTFGLDKNSVKVRDYLLSGSKFKLSDNIVYKENNIPLNLNLKFVNKNGQTITANSVTQQTILKTESDSLIKSIEKSTVEKPPTVVNNKPLTKSTVISAVKQKMDTAAAVKVSKPKPAQVVNVPKQEEVSVAPKVETPLKIVELPKAEESAIVKQEEIVSVPKSEAVITSTQAKMEIVKQTDTVKKITVKREEAPQLAADMVTTKKIKKVKFIEEKKAEVVSIVVPEKPIEQLTGNVIKEEMPEPVKEEIAKPEIVNLKKPEIEKLVVKIEDTPKADQKIIAAETPKVMQPVIAEVKKEMPKVQKAEVNPEGPKLDTIAQPDVYYKIQLASYEVGDIKFPEFDYLGKVEVTKAYDRYIYRLGDFYDLERAKVILDQVRAKGYFVAFILQYNKNKVTGIVK